MIEEILNSTSVHPIRDDSMKSFISETGSEWSIVEQLIRENRLIESEFNNRKFYLRKLKQSK